MTAEELLSRIHELGIELGLDGDDLGYSAPKGTLTQELRAELAEHKADILTLLREAHTSVSPDQASRFEPEMAGTFAAPRTPVEAALAKIWTEVLGIEQVGIHDNFFELGGDSILGLQVVEKAHQLGLRFAPYQILEHQTIGELATMEGTDVVQAEQEAVTGVIPLTCNQSWFLDQAVPALLYPHRWNVSELLQVESSVSPPLVSEAVQCLWVHHDGLRLHFLQSAAGWQGFIADPDETAPFTAIDLTMLPVRELQHVAETLANEIQCSLDFKNGPLFRAVLFIVKAQGQNRLLLLWHHLVTDGYSNKILLQDMEIACRQLIQGEPVKLPPKTTSLRQWTEQLHLYAQSDALGQELDYWLSRPWSQIPHLPSDYPPDILKDMRSQSGDTIELSLDIEETQYLTRYNPGPAIENACLMALVCSITRWTEKDWVEIMTVSSGRNSIPNAPDLDLSRTVGWLAATPVLILRRPETDEPIKALESIEAQLHDIPSQGRGYPILANLRDKETTRKMNLLPRKGELLFNYLGRQDQQELPTNATSSGKLSARAAPSKRRESSARLFKPTSEVAGQHMDPRDRGFTRLLVFADIREGCLHTCWIYNIVEKRVAIEQVANDYMKTLQALVAHYRSLEEE